MQETQESELKENEKESNAEVVEKKVEKELVDNIQKEKTKIEIIKPKRELSIFCNSLQLIFPFFF